MEKNILDLSKLTNRDLLDELQSRGYYTDLIFCTEDVDMQLESINEERDEDKQIVLTNEQKVEALTESFNVGWYCERMNEDIYNHISNLYED
jgi:hypothetical protein